MLKLRYQISEIIRRERAASLVLISIVLVVILALLGFALDLGISYGGNTGQKKVADLAVLGALKAYWQAAPIASGDLAQHQERLKAALKAVREIVGFQENKTMTQSFLANPSEIQNNICIWGDPFAGDSEYGCSDPSGKLNHGWLVPGKWYATEPSPGCGSNSAPNDSAECPCKNGKFNGPCFSPLPAGETRTNAFQLELKQSQSNPTHTIFAKFVGQNSFNASAISTASLRPRHVMFVVDFSESITAETHNPYLRFTQASHYAFKLKNACTPGSNPFPTRVTNEFADPTAEQIYNALNPMRTDPNNNSISAADPSANLTELHGPETNHIIPDPDEIIPCNMHFKDDYSCVRVDDDGDTKPAYYLIDTFSWENPKCNGPQPLGTVLNSLQSAFDTFRKRTVWGDQISLYGFDRVILDSRKFDPTSPDSNNSKFRELRDTITLFDKQIEHVFFPRTQRTENVNWRTKKGVFTNITYALDQAAQALSQSPGASEADQQIVLFSDMLPNCMLQTNNHHNDETPLSPENEYCSNELGMVDEAVIDAFRLVIQRTLVPKGIALNIVFAGDPAGPHSLVLTDGQNGCMDEASARKLKQPWVNYKDNSDWGYVLDPESFKKRPDVRFYLPNRFFFGAEETGGVWGVIRPCCSKDPKQPGKLCTDISDELKNYCAAQKGKGMGAPVTGTPRTDNYGRLRCDPLGRDTQTQMRSYMEQIVGQNPYTLVGKSKAVTF